MNQIIEAQGLDAGRLFEVTHTQKLKRRTKKIQMRRFSYPF